MSPKQPKIQYICSHCGNISSKWLGKCPVCGEWNSYEEKVLQSVGSTGSTKTPPARIQTTIKRASLQESLENITDKTQRRLQLNSSLLQEFFNGGITSDSLTLLAGEPGLGKSTFALQLLRSALDAQNIEALYVTAEESIEELTRRAQRIGVPTNLQLLQSQQYESIEKEIITTRPQLVILDSIQTIYATSSDSAPGSVAQVTNIATQLLSICKTYNIAIIIIGHVTKDGSIAGPRTLEHLVDSVLLLERSQHDLLTVSFIKYRFGTTESLLFLRMGENGLSIVQDPSLLLLENLEDGVGITYSIVRIKNQNIVVEVQALASKNIAGIGYQRQGIGITNAKLNSLIAIMKKYLHYDMDSMDVYVSLIGLPKGAWDESLDLAIALALISSIHDTPLPQLFRLSTKQRQVFAGRLTLSGSIRPATANAIRLSTAKKLKLDYNPAITPGEIRQLITLVASNNAPN